jgi:hypothetical protein
MTTVALCLIVALVAVIVAFSVVVVLLMRGLLEANRRLLGAIVAPKDFVALDRPVPTSAEVESHIVDQERAMFDEAEEIKRKATEEANRTMNALLREQGFVDPERPIGT